jgi:hypothetical protein
MCCDANIRCVVRVVQSASAMERKNVLKFLSMISQFEQSLGLQQPRDPFRSSVRRSGGMTSHHAVGDPEELQPTSYGVSSQPWMPTPTFDGDDALTIQLGTKLRVGLRFFTTD